jgi:hypothetical protein
MGGNLLPESPADKYVIAHGAHSSSEAKRLSLGASGKPLAHLLIPPELRSEASGSQQPLLSLGVHEEISNSEDYVSS